MLVTAPESEGSTLSANVALCDRESPSWCGQTRPSGRRPILTAPQTLTLFRSEAYAIGKKEKPPFLPEEPSSSSEEDDPIPDELLCLICKDIMTDAVVIPCCGNSYCDECKTHPWATRGWGAATVGSAGVTSGSPRTKRLRAVGNAGRECALRPSPVTCRVARDREEPVQAALCPPRPRFRARCLLRTRPAQWPVFQ